MVILFWAVSQRGFCPSKADDRPGIAMRWEPSSAHAGRIIQPSACASPCFFVAFLPCRPKANSTMKYLPSLSLLCVLGCTTAAPMNAPLTEQPFPFFTPSGIEMTFLPGGAFTMGSDQGETDDVAKEHPDVVGQLAKALDKARADGRTRP